MHGGRGPVNARGEGACECKTKLRFFTESPCVDVHVHVAAATVSYRIISYPIVWHRTCTVEPLYCGHLGDIVKCPV